MMSWLMTGQTIPVDSTRPVFTMKTSS